MMQYTSTAQARLQLYCDAIRDQLESRSDVDATEVVDDVRAHLESALAGAVQPIGLDQLEQGLEALGDPVHWVGLPERPAPAPLPRRDLAASIAAIALAIAGVAFEPLLIPVAYGLARFRLSRSQVAPAERWLVMPPIALGTAAVVALALLWPFGMSVAFGGPGGFIDYFPRIRATLPHEDDPMYWVRILAGASVVAGLWWTSLGAILRRRNSWAVWLLEPVGLAGRTWGPTTLRVAGIVLASAGLAATILLA